MIELDAWKLSTLNSLDTEDILKRSRELAKETEKESVESVETPQLPSFGFKHRWICSKCSKNGQQGKVSILKELKRVR